MYSIRELIGELSGKTVYKILKGDISRIVVTEHGARILGVFIGDSPNVFWTNRSLGYLIRRREWNIGGNRIWISPERRFFYKKPEEFEGWYCPRGLDPAYYRFREATDRLAVLETLVKVYDWIAEKFVTGGLIRQIRLLEDGIVNGISYCRIEVMEAINVRSSSTVNLWTLTQVYPGEDGYGVVIVPTVTDSKPVHYFGPIPEDRLVVADDHVEFLIDGRSVFKLGVRPEDLRMELISYLFRQHDGRYCLIVSSSHDLPRSQSECLDVAKYDPKGPRGAVQSYNSDPELSFGEIELHFRPAVYVHRRYVSVASHTLDIYLGVKEDMVELVKRKLGIKKITLLS